VAVAVLSGVGCKKSEAAPEPTPVATPPVSVAATARAPVERVRIDDVAVPTAPSKVHVGWVVPVGTGVNDDAPFRLRWKTSDGLSEPPQDVTSKGASVSTGFDVDVKPNKGTNYAKLVGDVDLVVCDVATHSVCVPVKRELEMTFAVAGNTVATPVKVNLPAARATTL
jgi:hypothetical protein